jgi:hypothetical protein
MWRAKGQWTPHNAQRVALALASVLCVAAATHQQHQHDGGSHASAWVVISRDDEPESPVRVRLRPQASSSFATGPAWQLQQPLRVAGRVDVIGEPAGLLLDTEGLYLDEGFSLTFRGLQLSRLPEGLPESGAHPRSNTTHADDTRG